MEVDSVKAQQSFMLLRYQVILRECINDFMIVSIGVVNNISSIDLIKPL